MALSSWYQRLFLVGKREEEREEQEVMQRSLSLSLLTNKV